MAWVFNKTLWVQDNPPYITAAQMNRIEAGIDAVTPKTLDLNGVNTGTFAGLDGVADKAYWIEGVGYLTNGNVLLKPNGATANSFRNSVHSVYRVEDNTFTHSVADMGINDGFALTSIDWGLPGDFTFTGIIQSRRIPGSSPKTICRVSSVFTPNADGLVWPAHRVIERDFIGIWYDNAAPLLNSLTVTLTAGIFTDARISLRAIGR